MEFVPPTKAHQHLTDNLRSDNVALTVTLCGYGYADIFEPVIYDHRTGFASDGGPACWPCADAADRLQNGPTAAASVDRQAIRKVVVAEVVTEHFTFEGVGPDAPGAIDSLLEAFRRHGREYNLDADWYDRYLGSVRTRALVTGCSYRDGDELLPIPEGEARALDGNR